MLLRSVDRKWIRENHLNAVSKPPFIILALKQTSSTHLNQHRLQVSYTPKCLCSKTGLIEIYMKISATTLLLNKIDFELDFIIIYFWITHGHTYYDIGILQRISKISESWQTFAASNNIRN